jgi:hypothetical protein
MPSSRLSPRLRGRRLSTVARSSLPPHAHQNMRYVWPPTSIRSLPRRRWTHGQRQHRPGAWRRLGAHARGGASCIVHAGCRRPAIAGVGRRRRDCDAPHVGAGSAALRDGRRPAVAQQHIDTAGEPLRQVGASGGSDAHLQQHRPAPAHRSPPNGPWPQNADCTLTAAIVRSSPSSARPSGWRCPCMKNSSSFAPVFTTTSAAAPAACARRAFSTKGTPPRQASTADPTSDWPQTAPCTE